jgi:hypothetical protein
MLSIAGIDYKVEWNDGKIESIDEDGNEIKLETIANIHFLDNVINLCGDYTQQTTDISYVHEVVHGILFAMGYQRGFVIPDDEVERFTEGFAQVLLHVMNQIIEYNVHFPDEEEYDTIVIDKSILEELEE